MSMSPSATGSNSWSPWGQQPDTCRIRGPRLGRSQFAQSCWCSARCSTRFGCRVIAHAQPASAVEMTGAPRKEGPRVLSGEALRVLCPDHIGGPAGRVRRWNGTPLLRSATGRLLMDFLMDGAARSVIHRHGPARRIREASLQRHFLTQPDTA